MRPEDSDGMVVDVASDSAESKTAACGTGRQPL
jgi:hypothetical protein